MATRRSFKPGLGPLRTAEAGVRSEWARHTLHATFVFIVLYIFISYSSFHVAGPQPQIGLLRYISFPTTAHQIHTSETWGIHQASLNGAYNGDPVVINIWLRTLCAANQSVVRGFASAEFFGTPTATYDGVELLPEAITSRLPPLRVYLTDRQTGQVVEQLYSNTQYQHLRSIWHFQAEYPFNVTIAAIGMPEWDTRVHIPSSVPCSISASPVPNLTWAQAGSSWSVVYLPMAPMNSFGNPNNSPDTMHQHVTTDSGPLGCSKRQAEPLFKRVLRTLSGNQRAGVSGLILISPDSTTLQQLLQHSAIQGAANSGELVLWLWVSTHISISLHTASALCCCFTCLA